ncbi:MAG: dihydrodipicolinate synthase family protein [Thermosphaera sp.]
MPKPGLPRGILTALITPVHEKEDTLRESLSRIIEFQLKSGIKGFYTLGTYGEGLLLPVSKRKKIISLIADLVPSNYLIINNVSAASLEDSLELAKHSIELGVENIASLPPLYYKAGMKELKNYYGRLGKLECNLFVYNNPSKTGVDVTPSIIKQLKRDIQNLAGVKDSTGSVERVIDIVSNLLEDFYVGIASDSLILDSLIYGADAHICGVCNAIPEIAVEIVKSFEAGDLKRASRLQILVAKFRGLSKEYQVEGLVLTKAALKVRGFDIGLPAEPLNALSENDIIAVKEVLDNIYRKAGIKI